MKNMFTVPVMFKVKCTEFFTTLVMFKLMYEKHVQFTTGAQIVKELIHSLFSSLFIIY